jgi:protein-disulfide isomerase
MKSSPARTGFALWPVLAITWMVASIGCALRQPADVQTVSPVGATAGAPAADRPPAPPDARSLGSETAPVAIVEYSDYQCPYCRRFHEGVLPGLKRQYIDTGKVRLFFRDLPLTMHREAMPAAIAARCAADQGQFWPMNEALFARQPELGDALYRELARNLKLDRDRFEACSHDPATRRRVDRDVREAAVYGVTGTPSFMLGRYENGRMEVRRVARGYVDFDGFAREIEQLLAEPAAPAAPQ